MHYLVFLKSTNNIIGFQKAQQFLIKQSVNNVMCYNKTWELWIYSASFVVAKLKTTGGKAEATVYKQIILWSY